MSLSIKIGEWLVKKFYKKRIFIKSKNKTVYITLRPYQQILGLLFFTALGAWTIISASYIAIDNQYDKNMLTNTSSDEQKYLARLNSMAMERDEQVKITNLTRQRFLTAVGQLSKNQSSLLNTKAVENELTLANKALKLILTESYDKELTQKITTSDKASFYSNLMETKQLISFLSTELEKNALLIEETRKENIELKHTISDLKHKALVSTERTERIFSRLEEAVTVSVAPLEKMFEDVGISTDKLLKDVRRGYSGTGGPLMPLKISKIHSNDSHLNTRANEILNNLDTLNLYRIAAFKTPFSHPLKVTHRFTSAFGIRKDPTTGRKQMHHGIDLAAYSGSKIHATADGTVTKAWPNGAYGKLIEIRHAMGYRTRYAHLKRIRVKAGQIVARGDVIGDMGNTGRSTGTHLHYEIRKNGTAINPMKYIKAARNVF